MWSPEIDVVVVWICITAFKLMVLTYGVHKGSPLCILDLHTGNFCRCIVVFTS